DRKKKEEAEIRNEADNLIYAADKLVKQDLKDKVSPEQVEKVNKITQEIRDAIASNNLDNIRAKIQELKTILAEISTQAYQSAGASSAQAGAAGPEFAGGGPTGSAAGPEFAGGGPTGSAAGPNPSP
ncbi:MAG: Hsp70 family protein, partial [Thermoproteota archaeon]|nr:Hsp70 family protein [Thermoproteota archaeon]